MRKINTSSLLKVARIPDTERKKENNREMG